ncbi:MAG: stage 0 sporulation family protein [bacterium]
MEEDKSYEIIGVRFGGMPNTYFFQRNQVNVKVGDLVIAETERGPGIGIVVSDHMDPKWLDSLGAPLRKTLRKATERDLQADRELRILEKKAFELCSQKEKQFRLDMNLVAVQYYFDRSKAVFYFTAEGRVDFRELVKDLARTLNTRIEMRQIGVRDKAKLVGGIGSCGRELCCKSFLKDFEPVSVRMAKDQNLTLNPSKISGVCGRLMCCLTFEHGIYKDLCRDLPKCGKKVQVSEGVGKVTRQNPLEGTVLIELEDGREIEVGREAFKENR